jgi:hypothetical protein
MCPLYTVGVGCSDYENRPEDCKTYQCIWVTQSDIDVKYRPDKLNVVFEQPLGKKYWLGIELKDNTLQQENSAKLIRAMNNDGASILLKSMDGRYQHSLPEGKSWEERRDVSGLVGKSLEKVLAWYKGFTLPEKVSVLAKKISINIQQVFIIATKKK